MVRENRLAPSSKLPPVFPLVLYNGDARWNAAQDMKALIELPAETPLWSFQPAIRYYLLDESRYPNGKAGSLVGLLFQIENCRHRGELIPLIRQLTKGQWQGVIIGEAEFLRRLLNRRFGALPEWVDAKLAQADRNNLELWGMRVLDVKTLNEVFG